MWSQTRKTHSNMATSCSSTPVEHTIRRARLSARQKPKTPTVVKHVTVGGTGVMLATQKKHLYLDVLNGGVFKVIDTI